MTKNEPSDHNQRRDEFWRLTDDDIPGTPQPDPMSSAQQRRWCREAALAER